MLLLFHPVSFQSLGVNSTELEPNHNLKGVKFRKDIIIQVERWIVQDMAKVDKDIVIIVGDIDCKLDMADIKDMLHLDNLEGKNMALEDIPLEHFKNIQWIEGFEDIQLVDNQQHGFVSCIPLVVMAIKRCVHCWVVFRSIPVIIVVAKQ